MFALGTVSVLVPRRWMLDNGILNSRLATWILEEIFFHFSLVSHRPVHLAYDSMCVEHPRAQLEQVAGPRILPATRSSSCLRPCS